MPGVGVDAHDPGDRALDPGLLERLADRRLGDGLAEVDRAAGECPAWPRPPPADTPDTSPVVTTSQVTTALRDFAVSLRITLAGMSRTLRP